MLVASRRLPIACVLAAVLAVPEPCHAWGQQGHRIVARIATKNLRQTTRDKLRAILGVSDGGLENAMASAAIWPDLIDRVATGSDRGHYIKVPISAHFSGAVI